MTPQPLDEIQLIRYALGELSGVESGEVESLLELVPEAARFLERVLQVVDVMKTTPLEAATPEAIRRAVAAYEPPEPAPAAAPRPTWLDQARTLLARLVYDSRAQPALAGFRSSGTEGYRCSFQSGDMQVHVSVAPDTNAPEADAWCLRGQIDGAGDDAPDSVQLIRQSGDGDAITARPDAHGQFALDAGTGRYDLLVAWNDRMTLVMPDLDLGN